ncbi:MAG: glycosyltransferase [Planctomycetes bacterium]|nr:glycosyltransferase [Planctomycetota bacterium]MCB9885872.1 glycosyltransferase [Planctomycetota bacterium]
MTARLCIVRVLPFFGEAFGGPVAQAQRVHRELLARGHEVQLLSSDLGLPDDVPRDTWHDRDGVRTFFARARGWGTRPPYAPPRPAVRALREALTNADVASVNVGLSLWGPALARHAAAARVPFVYNAEGALDPVRLRLKAMQKRVFLGCCERRVLRGAAAIQAVTEHEATALFDQGAARERVHVIPNGVALADPPTAAQRRRGRERLGLPQDAVVVLFFGRLHAVKGLDLLIDAAAPLLRGPGEVHLAVVGPDEGAGPAVRRQVQALGLQHRVHIHGGVDATARGEVLAAADLFALTSHSEGLPNAAIEAAAAGLPLLLSDACHLPQVAEYDAGAICAASPPSIAAALTDLLRDPERRRGCGDRARRMAEERFALGRVVDALEQLYRDLAAAGSR